MQYHYSPFIIPLILAAVMALWISYYAFTRRSGQGSVFLGVLGLFIAEWLVAYALEIAGSDLPTKIFWGEMQYLGISLTPMLWFVFAYMHSNKNNDLGALPRILLTIIPNITVILAFTAQSHGLLWKTIGLVEVGSFSALEVTYGPWFWVHSVYSYLLLAGGAAFVLRSLGRKKGLFRGQSAALAVAVAAPWVGNFIYLAGWGPFPYLDLTPFAFMVTILAVAWAVMGFQLVNLSPFAREFILEHMADGVIVFDGWDRATDINAAAQKILHKPAAWGVGQKVDEILDFHPGLLESYQQGKAFLGEIQPGGAESRWYDFSVSALKDGVRQPIGRLLTISDITERKRAEEALALARDQAMQASLFKSQLLGKVSHELHTPLVAIQGYSELMRYGTFGVLTEKQIEATDQIIASVKYLNGIVNDLLEEAQISAQKTVLRVEPFSLPVLLRYVEANLSAQASRKGLEFSLKVARTLPEILYGDEGRLRQILLNLAGNAIKFTGAGRVCMEVDRLDPAQWMVRVTDTGVGIPPESIADIFEPFRQVQTALPGGDEGTGLGLTITRQLVEMMGGKIMVESQLGLGSTFTIVLPLIENLERPRAVATGLDL